MLKHELDQLAAMFDQLGKAAAQTAGNTNRPAPKNKGIVSEPSPQLILKAVWFRLTYNHNVAIIFFLIFIYFSWCFCNKYAWMLDIIYTFEGLVSFDVWIARTPARALVKQSLYSFVCF